MKETEEQKKQKEQKKQNEEKIKELKQQKKEMQDQLDELNGRTAKSKAVCVLVFLLVLAALMGTFTGMVKADVGGVASNLLAPAIGNVPVLKNILPKDLQAADPAQTADTVDSTQTADTQSAAGTQGTSTTDPTQTAGTQNAAGTSTTDPTQQDTEAAALADYVKTYSDMKPKDAASVFDGMMPDQMKLVVKILKNMSADQRSAILSKMNVQNASDITVEMNKELP
jgi:hypothetical protein